MARTPLAVVIAAVFAVALACGVGTASAATCDAVSSCTPGLTLSKSGPSYVNQGATATYTYTLSNPGADDIDQIVVADDKCAAMSAPSGDSGSDGILSPGETWTYTCSYAPSDAPGTAVENHATADGIAGGEVPVHADAYWTTQITALDVKKTVDLPTADPFDTLTYTITISNDGPSFFGYEGFLNDSGCDDAPQSNDPQTDGTWFSLQPGESVTYTCHHLFNPGPGEGQDSDPYVNQACADVSVIDTRQTYSASNDSQADLEVCDSASTSVAKHVVTGRVFEDMNADGVEQAGEPAMPGVVVYADLNGNGARDPGEPVSTSDAQGNYSLSVALGSTTIREEIPAGATCSFPSGCAQTVALPKNSPPTLLARATDPTGADFGNWLPASVSGTVVGDQNGNGVRDGGESGLGGILVYADLNGNGDLDQGEPSTTTAADGTYAIAGLKPGGYVIRHILIQDGRTCTAPASGCAYDLTLVSRAAESNKDFLDAPAPDQLVLPERIVPGVARLLGKTGCVRGGGFTAGIRGQSVLRMTLFVDGRAISSIALPKDGMTYRFRVNVARLRVGTHVLSLRVVFHRKSGTRSKTLRLTFQRCAASLRAPRFTG